jgi:hypothetical protein
MDDKAFPTLTTLARRTGVPAYRLAQFAALLALPLVSSVIAAIAAR